MHFKRDYSFENRLKEATNIMKKYPSRIPVICEKSYQDNSVPDIDRHKYLVPNNLTIGQFIYIIRSRLKLSSGKALYFIVKDSIPPTSELIGNVYLKYHDVDRFLYLRYTSENTFG